MPHLETDASLLGRMALLLEAVLRHGVASTDDALLDGELNGRRHGNPKSVGAAVATAHRRGWIRPAPSRHHATRLCLKSARTTRASGPVELWTATATTAAALEALRRQLATPPAPACRGLFDDIP